MATLDLRRQLLSEDRHLLAFRRANVCRKVPLKSVFMPERSKQQQIGKLACAQPRKLVSLPRAAECKTPVTVDPVPAQIGDFESFAGHGLHRVSEDRFYLSDFCRHGRGWIPSEKQPEQRSSDRKPALRIGEARSIEPEE